jgi:hypothetical protein
MAEFFEPGDKCVGLVRSLGGDRLNSVPFALDKYSFLHPHFIFSPEVDLPIRASVRGRQPTTIELVKTRMKRVLLLVRGLVKSQGEAHGNYHASAGSERPNMKFSALFARRPPAKAIIDMQAKRLC